MSFPVYRKAGSAIYGKHFASTYTGSLMGAGADVFAVWGYCIANTVSGVVELNPPHVGALLGMPLDAVERAIAYLCAPDERSRSSVEGGCRLVREGRFSYRVPTWEAYRAIRSEDERRVYNRQKQAEHRARARSQAAGPSSRLSLTDPVSRRESRMSAQAEAEAETEAEVHPPISPPAGRGGVAVVPRQVSEIKAWVDGALRESLDAVTANAASRAARERLHGALAAFVFAYAQSRWGHEGALLDPKRERYLRRALAANGGNVHILLYAADGALKDDVIAGRREDGPKGGYLRISTVYRDQEQVERLSRLAGYQPGAVHRMAEAHGLKVVA